MLENAILSIERESKSRIKTLDEDVENAWQKIRDLRKEVDDWRNDYYSLKDSNVGKEAKNLFRPIPIPQSNPLLFNSKKTASKLSVPFQKPDQEELKKTLPFPFALPKQKEISKQFIKLNVEQHCYENRIGENKILSENKEELFTKPTFPQGEIWTCAQVKCYGNKLEG